MCREMPLDRRRTQVKEILTLDTNLRGFHLRLVASHTKTVIMRLTGLKPTMLDLLPWEIPTNKAIPPRKHHQFFLAEETKHAHKFAPSAGLDHPQSQRPTYCHKPGPVLTPIMPGSSPDASVAVVSGAAFKTMNGLLVTIVVAGLVLL